ncbi:MAG: hypothetical protein OK456_05965 [Thaumarchaeota archaeon]|nr:hypothetical protein [Nitrososphaerota archaeon]
MLNLVDLSVGFGFGVLGSVGIVAVMGVLNMFKGDVMEQLFKFMVAGFVLITAVGYGDAILLIAGEAVPSGIFGAVLMVSFALLLIGLIRLILWNEKSTIASMA